MIYARLLEIQYNNVTNIYMQKILGIPRNVFFLGLVSMFNDFSSEMVQSVMPLFLTTVLGAPIIMVGVIEGVADVVASTLKIISGWLSDNQGRHFY